jgi:hypothetical protein
MGSKCRDSWSYNNCRGIIVGIFEAISAYEGVNVGIPGATVFMVGFR